VSLFSDQLHRASWRGVPFGVDLEDQQVGGRYAVHEYPNRDGARLEALGARADSFRVRGFLISDSAVYGGGDVIGQRKRMEAAARTSGSGTLVHPQLGRLTLTCLSATFASTAEEGGFVAVTFSFMKASDQLFPTVAGALSALVGKVAGLADVAGLSAFSAKVLQPLASGLGAVADIEATAESWLGKVDALGRDATSLLGTVSQLGGADYGRYFNGRNSGFLEGLSSVYSAATSISDLIGIGSTKRAAIGSAATGLRSAIADLGGAATPGDVAHAAQATVAALAAAAADPADAVRTLTSLAAFQTPAPAALRTAGAAVSDLFQRSAAAELARASATYAPASADDAHAVRDQVLAPIQAAIAAAGDSGEDEVFSAFRSLRKAVVDDLGARGGALARLAALDLPSNLPAVVVAQRQYADAGRADELIVQADPIHPWFMPLSFRALAA
jgi:prophage DNA circulation protein